MTTLNQIVARQITLAGERLLLAVEPLDDEEFFRENANGFSAAWVLGHLACVADLFSSWFDSEKPLLGRPFHAVFNETAVTADGPASKAASVDRELYGKAVLQLRFREAMTKALLVLEEFYPGDWDSPAPAAAPLSMPTSGRVWETLAVHTDWHCGELAGSMPRFFGTYALNPAPHHLYVPPAGEPAA